MLLPGLKALLLSVLLHTLLECNADHFGIRSSWQAVCIPLEMLVDKVDSAIPGCSSLLTWQSSESIPVRVSLHAQGELLTHAGNGVSLHQCNL